MDNSNAHNVRTRISKRNPYYISNHRYLELRYFCLQYKEWKKELLKDTDSNRKENLKKRVELIELAASQSSDELCKWILIGVTDDKSFNYLKTVLEIPCGRDMYYNRYRKFFYLLSEMSF